MVPARIFSRSLDRAMLGEGKVETGGGKPLSTRHERTVETMGRYWAKCSQAFDVTLRRGECRG